MLVTLSGMVMLVRLVQPEKAEPPMLFTPSLMRYSPLKVFFAAIK